MINNVSIKKNSNNFNLELFFSLFLVFLFLSILLNYNLILKVTPADPLQYVFPAIVPEVGFPFLDRIFLWYFIRFISIFGVSNEYLGGIATLTQTSILLFIILFWLSKKFDILTASTFFFIFLLCKFWLPHSTYTYPTQLLGLITIGSVLLIDFIKSEKTKYIFLGCATVLAIFSKVQGFAFFLIILFLILSSEKKLINTKYFFFGLSGFFISFICMMSLIDGLDIFLKLYNNFFLEGNFSAQVKGRGLSNYPNFFIILKDPQIFVGFTIMTFAILFNKLSKLRPLAILAFSQILFLLLIYYVTERGGPVIKNYFLESITISLIFLAVLSSRLIKNFFLIFSINNNFLISIFIIFFAVLIFLINLFNLNEIRNFYYNNINIINEKMLWILIISFSSLIISFSFFILNFKKQFYILFFSIFLIVFFESSLQSIKQLKKGMDWLEPYYVVSNLIKLNHETEKKNLIFHASLNRSDFDDAERRVRRIAFTILEVNPEDYKMYVCKGSNCNRFNNNTNIITDDLEYISLLNKENFISNVLIDKSKNLTLNKTLYLLKK